MKSAIFLAVFLFGYGFVKAQDTITLKTGETIAAKVAEVGINEIKYYKSTNPDGPVYVLSKTDVSGIKYANGTSETFPLSNNQTVGQQPANVVVTQPAPQTVVVERPYRRTRPFIVPVFVPHINLGHINIGHHGGGHHGSRHH